MDRGIIILFFFLHLLLLGGVLSDGGLELWIVIFQLLLPDCLHKLVHLGDLLVCLIVSIAMIEVEVEHEPLILSIFALSIFSPLHFSPSICCAYPCHSVRKPIYASVSVHAPSLLRLDLVQSLLLLQG
jgi:hypothetical protein